MDSFMFILLTILFRIGFIGFTIFLIYLIIRYCILLKKHKLKKCKVKLAVVCVALCACVLLGYTEPTARIRIKTDAVTETFTYVTQNKDVFSKGQNYSTDTMFGWVSCWDAETTEKLLEEIKMTESEKKESMNWYPTYVFYDEIDGIEIYYEEAKCKRWESLGHFTVDLLGVPDRDSVSTKVYLISDNECVVFNVNYSGKNPCSFLLFINNPYFFYSPEIDLHQIVSGLSDAT